MLTLYRAYPGGTQDRLGGDIPPISLTVLKGAENSAQHKHKLYS